MKIKWQRQPDGSYTSEAGRVRRDDTGITPRSWRVWRYEPNVPNCSGLCADSAADGKRECEQMYRAHQLATMPTPPPSEILRCVIELEAARMVPDHIRLEALRACQFLTGLPPGLADVLTELWRAEQARERRRQGW